MKLRALLWLTTLVLAGCGRTASTPDPGYEDFRVDSFDLIDQHGEAVDESILDGQYTVLDFIFTNCPIYCPAMGRVMLRVQRETEGTGARLVSVSVDGVNDTPEVLAEYAESLGADTSRWVFLTGDPAQARSLAEDQLKLGVATDPTRPVTLADGSTMDFIDHPTRLVLIGPDRRVLGMYSYADDQEISRLIQRLRRLVSD